MQPTQCLGCGLSHRPDYCGSLSWAQRQSDDERRSGLRRPSCPDGCSPVDVCGTCDGPVSVSGAYAWHVGRATVHDAVLVVRCAACGAIGEPVSPDELAEAVAAMLSADPVEGQTSWL